MGSFFLLPLLSLTIWVVQCQALQVDFSYHHYPQMTKILQDIAQQYPHITKLFSIGKSVQGRELWVMLVTNNPDQEELLKPNVKYIANMHGNEAIGREALLHFLAELVTGYGQDQYITWLMDNTRIFVMPSMNPDGFEMSLEGECSGIQGRGNANSFDLNRNFPDYFTTNTDPIQPETRAVMDWLSRTQFVLSANLHGGAMVASYPFDNIPANSPKNFRTSGSPSRTPDDDVFRHLAEVYSFNHRNMHLGVTCRDGTPPFVNGTTNGAAWYPLKGGMQDYNYVRAGCMEITIEMSCCKYPKYFRLPQFWNDNKRALLQYLGEAHQGVWGIVLDSERNPVHNASVKVKGRQFGTRTTPRGEYWRILRPGSYTLQVNAYGYDPVEVGILIGKGVTVQNITMFPNLRHEPRSDFTSSYNGQATAYNTGSTVFNWPTFTVMGISSFSVLSLLISAVNVWKCGM